MDPIAAGLVFLPSAAEKASCARRLLATSLAAFGFELESWQSVPAGDSGTQQLFRVTLSRVPAASDDPRQLERARKETEERAIAYGLEDFKVASLAHRQL